MEILIEPNMSRHGTKMLKALAKFEGKVVAKPTGNDKALMIYGVGHQSRKVIAEQHLAAGGQLVLWDLGYCRDKFPGAMRLSLNDWHPQNLLDLAPLDSSRWDRLHINLRNDFDPDGPVVLVGLGPKTRAIISDADWERTTYAKLKARFPDRRIIFRPKPKRPYPKFQCEVIEGGPIDEVLKGASLVVVRHSNVAVDAVIAGVPFEASDGAAKWLDGKPYTPENRLEFLWRLSFFNWTAEEAKGAWKMIHRCEETACV